jgi:hypothetical protein
VGVGSVEEAVGGTGAVEAHQRMVLLVEACYFEAQKGQLAETWSVTVTVILILHVSPPAQVPVQDLDRASFAEYDIPW